MTNKTLAETGQSALDCLHILQVFYDLSNQEWIHHCQCHNFSVEDDERSTRMQLIIDRQERYDRTASVPTLENPLVSGQSFVRKNCHVLRSDGE